MKPSRLEKTYFVLLLVILGGVVVHAPLSVGLGVLYPDMSLLIKSWKEILMAAALLIAVVLVTRRGLWKELLGDWLIRLSAAYALLHVLLVPVFYQGLEATAAGLMIDLRYVLFFCLVYVAMKLRPQWRKRILGVAVAGAAVVVGFAAVQLFLPKDFLSHIGYGPDTILPYMTVDKNHDYIRHNSTLRGPNPLGAYAGIVLAAVAAAWVHRRQWFSDRKVAVSSGLLFACGLVALWVSYSRSALVGGLMAVAIVLAVGLARRLSRTAWIAACVVVFALAGGLLAAKGTSFVSNVLLHENPEGGSSISSNDDHVSSLVTGWNKLLSQPLGAGVGSTGSASLLGDEPQIIENQYLFTAHETGWLGLVLFAAIFGLIMWRLWLRRVDWLALGVFASGVGLAAIGLLLPVWADDTVSVVWWGLAAVVLGGVYGRHTAK